MWRTGPALAAGQHLAGIKVLGRLGHRTPINWRMLAPPAAGSPSDLRMSLEGWPVLRIAGALTHLPTEESKWACGIKVEGLDKIENSSIHAKAPKVRF